MSTRKVLKFGGAIVGFLLASFFLRASFLFVTVVVLGWFLLWELVFFSEYSAGGWENPEGSIRYPHLPTAILIGLIIFCLAIGSAYEGIREFGVADLMKLLR